MAAQFQPGDVVQLKSGGPSMTVSHTVGGIGGDKLVCKWFEGNKLQSAEFGAAALMTPPAASEI